MSHSDARRIAQQLGLSDADAVLIEAGCRVEEAHFSHKIFQERRTKMRGRSSDVVTVDEISGVML